MMHGGLRCSFGVEQEVLAGFMSERWSEGLTSILAAGWITCNLLIMVASSW